MKTFVPQADLIFSGSAVRETISLTHKEIFTMLPHTENKGVPPMGRASGLTGKE
jgi:hypothetical protein